MEDHGDVRDRPKWTKPYQIERGDSTFVVHSYEIAGEQWKHGYSVFEHRGTSFTRLLDSDALYVRRDDALNAGKLYVETLKIETKPEHAKLEKIRTWRDNPVWRTLSRLARTAGL